MIAVYADKDFNDVRAIHPISMEFAYGEDENDFEVKMAAAAERMDALGYIYVDATECGGIITDIKNDTEDSQLVYSGLTWHGMLATKVIQPDSGEDYYKVSGEVNAVMNAILARIGLDGIMTAGSASTGSVIKSYQFDRYCNAYEGLRKMLASIGKTLVVQSLNGKVYLTAKDTASHTESATTERHAMPINHLVCLGEGELKDREVLHLYADGKGNVGTTQTLTGTNERAEVYDYSSADHDQLLEDGTKKLSEYQVFTSADMTDPTGGSYLIDDGLEVYDPVLDVSLSAQITKKIVTFDKDMNMSTGYECGNGYSSSTNSGASGGSGSGGGKTYVAGHGIKIADLTISAEVGASDLTAGLATKADTSHNHSASDITSGTLAIANGGTGSSTASAARTALGAAASSHTHAPADLTAAVPVSKGGTGATTAAAARTNLSAAAASHTHKAADITSVNASAITGTIAQANLPSYVDDVVEYAGTASFPATGEAGKIYTDTDTNKIYRWGGSSYVVISDTIALGETSSTAYRGDRGAAAYTHSQTTGNPHGTTKANLGLGNVENKSSATIRGELTKANVTTALGYTPPTANTTYGVATTSANGLMSSTDKSKLDGIAAGATVGMTDADKTSIESSISAVAAAKADKSHTHAPSDLASAVPISKGGTGSTTAAAALTALGAAAASHTHSAATNGAAGFMSAADKSKLDGIATGATANTVDSALSSTSTNAVQNKVVNSALAGKVPNTSAGVSAAINKLSTGTSTPVDADYYVCQYANGGTTTTTYHRRPLSSLWNWIKSKADSVYAAVSHTHAASAITSGTLAIANGGTGASTAAAARTNLGAAAASHNHSAADITSGTLPVARGGTGSTDGTAPYATYIGNGVAKYVTSSSTTNKYCRFATIETKSNYVDSTMLLAIDSGYEGGGFGIVKVSFRTDGISSTGTAHGKVQWLARYGFSTSQLFLKVYSVSNGGGTCYADLYFMANGTYQGFNARVLVGCSNRGTNGMGWTLKVEDPRAAADMRTYTSSVDSADAGVVSSAGFATSATSATKASKLATARTIALTGAVTGSATFDGSANVTITTTGQTAAANFLAAHPVGSTYEETTGTSPASAYGGTWKQLPSMGAFIWKRTA